MSRSILGVIVVVVGLIVASLVLVIRKKRPSVTEIDGGPSSAVLSYVSAAFGILIGFVIVFLLGQTTTARQAIGDEATSIGTAFDEAQLFPQAEPDLQHALICYSRAVTEVEWAVLSDGRSAPEADQAYRELVAAYGDVDEPTASTFQPAAATSTFAQIAGISTARETRIVTAESSVGPLLWALLFGGAAFVLLLLFVTTVSARPFGQALLLGLAGMFTAVLLVLVALLGNPYREDLGPLKPRLIEENAERMVSLAPEVAERTCSWEQ